MPTLKSFKGFSVCSLVWVLNKKQRMIAEGIETAAQLDLFRAQSCKVGRVSILVSHFHQRHFRAYSKIKC
jgi:hypothetical protein